jgi:hypothetical protein
MQLFKNQNFIIKIFFLKCLAFDSGANVSIRILKTSIFQPISLEKQENSIETLSFTFANSNIKSRK